MVVVAFDESNFTIEGGEWRGNDADMVDLLNTWTKDSIEVAVSPDDPFFDLYSPSNPYPDYTIAKAAAEAWEGEIVEVSELDELDDDAIY